MRKIELIGMINYLKNNILLFLIFTIGSIGLYSWFVGDFFLSTIINSYVSMAQSTSVIFCVISILLFLHLNFNKSKFLGLVISFFSLVIIIYCSLIIYKYNFGLQIKLENFYIVKPKTIGRILYGRMSPVTSILFVLSNINILIIFWKVKKRKLVSDLINFIILFITFIMLIGYLYHTPILYASKVIPIALPTAICFLFLSITFFNIHGLPFNFGKDKTLKYQLIKSFIPLIISIILIQGYFDSSVLNHQENKTLYVAIFVIISIIISIILIIRNSITIDKKLKNSEFLLKASEEQYRLLFKYMPVPTYTWQKVKDDLILIDYNEKADSFTNGNIKKIIGVKVSEFYKNDPKILNDFRQCLNQKTIIEREINYALLLSNERKYLNVKYAFVPPDLVIVHTEDITERKLSEIKLTNSELSLKQAQEIAGMGNWDFDLINNKNSWSENCFNIFGLKPNEVDPTFEYFKSRIHPDDVHLINDSLEEISKNRIPVQLDMRILFPLGEIKWFRNNIIPFFEGDKLVLIKGVNIDITERKKTEEELKESEHKYKELFEVNTDGITLFYINEQDGSISNIIDANENSAKMLGYTKEEILQFNPNDLEKDKTLEKIEKRKFDLLTKGFSNFETTILHKDGHEISVEIRVILVNYNNRPSLMNIVRDITERKQAEEVIRQSESLLRSITETTSDVIFVKDKEYRFLFINPAGCKLYNKTLEELIGKSKADFHTNPLEVEKFFADDKRIMESGKIEVIEEEVGYADGYIHTFLTTKVPRLDGQGNIIGLIGVAHDITERKQVELDLLKAKDRAEESDRLKSAFLANMSHEIRTPMNGIMGFAELLKEPQLTGEDQINYINIIQKSGVRMLNIINDIISISKIEAGLMEVSLSETNFNEQLDYIFTFFKPETESKGVKLSYNKFLPLNDALINTDKEKVYSILTNLVKNAIKYTDKGSINFGYTIKDGFIVFYVKDTGIGVPVNRQVAIFERFIQADIEDKRALQGAGLGLAITKAYVEMLGGEIWLESEDGKGSVFYFTIPYVKVVKDTTVVYNFYKNDIEINNTSLKILVVEDDEISDLFITRVLDKISKKVLHVRNGIDAVDIVRSNSDIDLILMDVNLPEMDGYEAVRHIREFNKDVIIIAQTAYALIGEKEKAIENGCNNYLSKPIDQALLKSLIKFYFNNP